MIKRLINNTDLSRNTRNSAGFTLLELIVVIAILTTLITTIIVVINPAQQFSKAHDTKRDSDINAIIAAIGQYEADNKGALPPEITTTTQTISKTGADICAELVTKYMSSLPVDPLTNNGTAVTDCSSSYNTNYTIVSSGPDNRVTVSAPATENGTPLSITR